MEDLTNREKEILLILIKSTDYISAEKIARTLHVSKKTIYRDLQSLEQKLNKKNIIFKQPGKGYYVNQSVALAVKNDQLSENVFLGMSTMERRNHILMLLLLQAPKETSVNQLAEYYYISNASIVNDLNHIENELGYCNLKFIRSHKGTYIDGKEENIRKLLMKILGYSFDFFQENSHINQETYHYLFREFSKDDIYFVEQLLREIEKLLNGNIREPYYINIFTHLLILIKRLSNSNSEVNYESFTRNEINNKFILEIAQKVVKKISDYLNLNVPTIEVFYIYKYLVSSGIENGKDVTYQEMNLKDSKEKQFTFELIRNISERLNIDFTSDLNLQCSLFLHIQPLAKRIEYGISICNPLLEDIKKEFSELFQAVHESVKEQNVFLKFKMLSDDEMGYIAVYFQASLEKRVQHKRVLIVCSSGIGTSHLLSARVKRTFPEWEIVDTISVNRITKMPNIEDIDFILTTVHLEPQKIPTALVSAIFSEFDILKVKNMLFVK